MNSDKDMLVQPRENSRFLPNRPHDVSILLVDCDLTCLFVISKMLRWLGYKVLTARLAFDAFCIVQDNKEEIDLILAEGNLPDMDKYEFLEMIRKCSNLPVVITISDNDGDVMLGCLDKGAEYCFAKPLDMEDLNLLWQVVLNRRSYSTARVPHQVSNAAGQHLEDQLTDEQDLLSRRLGKRKMEEADGDGEEDDNNLALPKKPKVVWNRDLHQRFMCAVLALGPEGAVPKKILQRMNVPVLTKEHISSHLQKYRQSFKQEPEYLVPNIPLPPLRWNQGFLPFPIPQPSVTVLQPPMGGYMGQGSVGNYNANVFNYAGPSQTVPPPMVTGYAGDFLYDLGFNTAGQGGLPMVDDHFCQGGFPMVNDHFGEFLMNNVQFDVGETSSASSVNRPAPLNHVFQSPDQQLEELLVHPTPFNHAFQGPDQPLGELLIPEQPQFSEPHEIDENVSMEGEFEELREFLFQMDGEMIQPAQDASVDGPSSTITD